MATHHRSDHHAWRHGVGRDEGVLLGGLAGAAAVLRWSLEHPVRAVTNGTAGYEELIAVACGGTASLVIGWLMFVTVAVMLATLPGRAGRLAMRCARRITPRMLHRLLPATLGVLVVATPMASATTASGSGDGGAPWPVHAVSVSAARAGGACADGADGASGLPGVGRPQVVTPVVLDRPPADDPEDGAPPEDRTMPDDTPPEQASTQHIVVERGQTLWSIADHHLRRARPSPAPPTPAEITAEWRRWFAANRSVIGEDPDLVHPGMRLTPPTHH
ncbi:hypothetical protein G1H11_18600 [Phytoactinopolyspora alkaliphila]|uniref:LysM peptidoglycan-binding domain-containing protein n=1 Tax=Phytoactinopolyspora alkaliphila TaxID=1783498 RepID=A0A6N9YQQ3_9ACTN|nr:hypothetical protein [Phytoactinopolyspora alkaliphila]NED97312.1 hypothetical protein [Phytoactinopolyspora alkaliphila]